jgi:hypothetical protein
VQLTWQLIAHVAMEDLTRIKDSLAEVAPMAARFPAFRVVLMYGEAEYQRIRGDSASALGILESVLPMCEAGAHQIWPQLAASHVYALEDAGQLERAAERGRVYLADAARAELGPSASDWISLALCVVYAKLGQPGAAHMAEALIERCLAVGATGLKLGLAYEARTRVAVLEADAASCERYRMLCTREFAKASNPALSAKLQKLKRLAQTRQLASQAPMLPSAEQSVLAGVNSRLRAWNDGEARARDILVLLAEHSGAIGGYLFEIRDGGPSWVASLGVHEPEAAVFAMVREYVMAEVHAGDASTGASELSVKSDWNAFSETLYRPVLLSHYTEAGHMICGVALLVVAQDRAFMYPGEVATQISRVLQESGDMAGLIVAD